MRTNLVAGVPPLSDDVVLVQSIQKVAGPAIDGGTHLCIGIEGPDRQIYRVIDTESLCEAVEIFHQLTTLGLTIDRGRHERGQVVQRVFRREHTIPVGRDRQ